MLFILSICNIGSVFAGSSDTKKHNLTSLFSAALVYDAEYQKAIYEREATAEELEQADARLYPAINLSAEAGVTNDETTNDATTLFSGGGGGKRNYNPKSFSLTLVQPIYRSDVIAGVLQADSRDRASEFNLKISRQTLMLRVIERYLTVLAAQDATEFTLKEEEAVQQQYKLAKARLDAQLGTEADLLDAKSRLASVRADSIAAQNVLDDALQALIEITGEDVTALALLGNINLTYPQPDSIDQWVNMALANNLAIMQRQVGVEIAREEVRRQRSGHHPTLDAVISKSRSTGPNDTATRGTQASIQFNLPIYQGGAINARTRQAKRLMEATIAELDQQRRAVAREVRAAFLGVKSALNRINSLEQAVSAQNLVVKTKRFGFPRVYNSLDVLDAESDLYSAKRDLARAKYDYLFSDARLSASVGDLNENKLTMLGRYFIER